ncbi:unnamed protein product [Sphagnum compactum]
MASGSSLHLPIVPHIAPPPPKSKRDWKDDSTALLMDLFEEKFLANSMNSLTQQQWQEILIKIEEAFPLTPPRTWAQVQSKVHKMRKKFNEFKQEHGESDVGQCKWPWFERCLMIWGKTAKACNTAGGGMDNGVPADSVGASAQEPFNLRDIEEHDDAPPSPDRQVPPFVGNSSQVSKTPPPPPTRRSIACKKPGLDGKPNKRLKRFSDGSIGSIAEALSKFADSYAKIEVMKIEVQKEIALKTMENQLAMVRIFAEIMHGSGSGTGGGGGGGGGGDGSGSKD